MYGTEKSPATSTFQLKMASSYLFYSSVGRRWNWKALYGNNEYVQVVM